MPTGREYITRRCCRGAWEESPLLCFLLEPAMCLGLLCCVALFIWGAGEVNSLDSRFRTFSYGCKIRLFQGLFVNFLSLSLQAPWTLRSLRVQVIWSKEKARKQRWIVSPWEDMLLFTGIATSWKHLSFWFICGMEKLQKIQTCSNSDFQLSAPKTHPAAWKSTPPRQRTRLCTSVPAASPQCCVSALLRAQTHRAPSSGNQWCHRRVGTNRNPPWKSIKQKEKPVNGHIGWAEGEVENSWWERKPKDGAGSCKWSQIPQVAGYLAKETQDVTLMGS